MSIDSRLFVRFWDQVLNADGDGCWLWLRRGAAERVSGVEALSIGVWKTVHGASDWRGRMRHGDDPAGSLCVLRHCDIPAMTLGRSASVHRARRTDNAACNGPLRVSGDWSMSVVLCRRGCGLPDARLRED
jgi:hypothetical protein